MPAKTPSVAEVLPPESPQPAASPDPFHDYRQLLSELELASQSLEKLEADLAKLDEQRLAVASEHARLLAESVENDSEKIIDALAKTNARKQVLDNRREHLQGPLEKAQVELQYAVVESGSRFGALYRHLRAHAMEQAAAKIAELVDPFQAALQKGNIQLLAAHSRELSGCEEVRIEPDLDCATPLVDRTPAQRAETLSIIKAAAARILVAAPKLLERVSAAKVLASVPEQFVTVASEEAA
jgi:hypothetical protein